MNVVWLRRSERRLEAIADYIARDNPKAAYDTIMRIRRAGNGLADMPNMGRSGRVEGTRELVILGTPYLLAYRVSKPEVQILHILHDKQSWPMAF